MGEARVLFLIPATHGGILGGVGVCVRVNPSYRGSVTTVGIYHCGTIVTAEDRHGLCPRDDGYSTGIIFNTRVTGGGKGDGARVMGQG